MIVLELIGQLWLLLATLTVIFSFRAIYRDWGYNKKVTKEKTCLNKRNKTELSCSDSVPSAVQSGSSTSNKAVTWSPGEAGLARSRLTEKRSGINGHAAAGGNRSKECR